MSKDSKVIDIQKHLKSPHLQSDGGGGTFDGMDRIDSLELKLDKIESDVTSLKIDIATIKGQLDWSKTAFTMLLAVTLGGFAITFNSISGTNSRISDLQKSIIEEFRSQRLETAEQTSAIANSITATKQQQPQILLVPTPKLDKK